MTFTEIITFTKIDCGRCGASYAINEKYRAERKEKGGYWHCPYCQCSWGYGDSTNAQLQRALEEKQRLLTAAKCETLRERQLKEDLERKQRRVARGVCPCCNRSFENLQRHMKTKHKELLKKA